MRIDLHVHSNRSDGTDDPATLVRACARRRIDVVALTDHDTFAGWDEARTEADRIGVTLVLGAEISCRLDGRSVHLLAYLPDPTYAPLVAELRRIRQGRDERVARMVEALRRSGVSIAVEDVAAQARATPSLGRPHVADALVALGYATDRADAFDRWLAEDRPGYVTRYAAAPEDAVALVTAAGGVPVLAHPWGRHSRGVLTEPVLAGLAARGLAGLEVDHHDHDAAARRALGGVARDLGLVVTGASDHHGAGKAGHALGSETTAPDQLERLLELARSNARASGRTVPDGHPGTSDEARHG